MSVASACIYSEPLLSRRLLSPGPDEEVIGIHTYIHDNTLWLKKTELHTQFWDKKSYRIQTGQQ